MLSDEKAEFTRETLYEAVWATPMRTLAKRHGCSDRGIAKLCKRYQIPVPPPGYWARRSAGHSARRTPLPQLSESQVRSLGAIVMPVPAPRLPAPSTIAGKQAALESGAEQRIAVASELRSPHPLVRTTKECFANAFKDDRHILHPDGRTRAYNGKHTGALAVHVSKDSIARALRVADALVKAIEARDWKVVCPAKGDGNGTGIQLLGEEVPISIDERVKRFDKPKEERRVTKGHNRDLGFGPYKTILVDPWTKWDYRPLGILQLRVRSGYGTVEREIADGATQRVEDRLNEFIVAIVADAERRQERTRQWAENERRRAEVERARIEAETARREAAARLKALESDANDWARAQRIREFVAACRVAAPAPLKEDVEYLDWASAQADTLDPIVRKRESNDHAASPGDTDEP